MSNFHWELMVFELNGNRLNEYGARAVVENHIKEGGGTVVGNRQYNLLTQRLYTPSAGERFDAL